MIMTKLEGLNSKYRHKRWTDYFKKNSKVFVFGGRITDIFIKLNMVKVKISIC